VSQPLPLWTHLETILQRCVTPEHCAIFLDYDGTLTPIVEDPGAARLSQGMRRTLQALIEHPRYRVAIVSGRGLADLRARVDTEGLFLAGNHGLEIEGPGLRFEHPEGQRHRHQLEALGQSLHRDLDGTRGAWVEDKGLTLSIHFRRVPAALVPTVQERVKRRVGPAIDSGIFTLRTGKAVLEIRPRVLWDKGEAVRWLLQQWHQDEPSSTSSRAEHHVCSLVERASTRRVRADACAGRHVRDRAHDQLLSSLAGAVLRPGQRSLVPMTEAGPVGPPLPFPG